MGNPNPLCPICASPTPRRDVQKNGYDIYVCTDCGFGFVFPEPSRETLEALYGRQYFKNEGKQNGGYTDYDKDKEPMRSVFELYLRKIERLVTGRDIFDVGAATGYFLDIARSRGWRTSGSEISAFGAEESSRRGHEIVLGAITELRPQKRVSVVTMWDVLEHVSRPVEYLRAVNAMLVPDGVVAINTVDRESLWARIMGSRWHLMIPPEHLSYFTRKSLEQALGKSGFEIIEYQKIGKSFSPAYVLKTLGSWQGLQFWNALARLADNRFFRFFSLPINLRDNVFVIAKKVHDVSDD